MGTLGNTIVQYGITTNGGDVEVDFSTIYGISNSTAKFSVSWKPSTSLINSVSSVSLDESNSSSTFRLGEIIIICLGVIIICMMLALFSVIRNMKIDSEHKEKPLHKFYDTSPNENWCDGVNESNRVTLINDSRSHQGLKRFTSKGVKV